MRTQAPSQYLPATISNLDIFVKVLLPAFFIRPSLGESFLSKGPINSECPLRQFKCNNGKCIQLAWMCDGTDDCGDNSDETAPQCTSLLYECREDQFTCRNGFCIAKEYYCDRERDCPDGSDEGLHICGAAKCEKDQFKCGPDFCIPATWVCDAKPDCPDGRDELDCKTCSTEEFTCHNGMCIKNSFVCDGDMDCSDGSDENNCTIKTCSEGDFQCGDKSCITSKWRCDGDYDCRDESDEKGCPKKDSGHSICAPNEFACPDRIHCIKTYTLCDGEFDCPDGGDESPAVCANVTCRDNQFQCNNYHCIEGHKRCDGHSDCTDSSDEDSCEVRNSCKEDEFHCGKGFCISLSKVCDNHFDCSNHEDEPKGKCGVNECRRRNGGCSDLCVDTITGHYCECRPGYKLINNFTCVDIDECDNPGSCSQICINKKGSFSCECQKGYKKDPLDATRCIANTTVPPSLIFTRRNDIRLISLDGKTMSTVVETNSSSALDFLFEKEEIFWSDTKDNKIYKAPINAGHLKTIVHNVSACEGIAVDWIYKNIYWTNTGSKTIEMSNYEGNIKKTLIKENLGDPRAIVVNPLDGWMYWTDWGNEGRIERAGLDGSNRRRIVSYEIKWANGLTLDLVRNRLYWVDAKTHMIASVNFDGSGRSLVLRSEEVLHHPYSVSVFEDNIYWTDWDKQTIFKANKFNGSNIVAIKDTRMLQNPMVVQVYHPHRQLEGINHCVDMNCSHLCLPVPSLNSYSPTVTCACPDDHSLHKDGTTCYNHLLTPNPYPNSEEKSPVTETPIVIDNNKPNDSGIPFFVVIGLIVLLLAVPATCIAVYKYYKSKTVNRITFDCPAYIKPGNDLMQGKKPFNKHLISSCDEEAQEPLRRPGTNSFV